MSFTRVGARLVLHRRPSMGLVHAKKHLLQRHVSLSVGVLRRTFATIPRNEDEEKAFSTPRHTNYNIDTTNITFTTAPGGMGALTDSVNTSSELTFQPPPGISVVKSVNRGGIAILTDVEGAALGCVVRILSSLRPGGAPPGTKDVEGVVVRIHEKELFVALYDDGHKVAVGDPVYLPSLDDAPEHRSPLSTPDTTCFAPKSIPSSRLVYPSFPAGPQLLGRVVDSMGHACIELEKDLKEQSENCLAPEAGRELPSSQKRVSLRPSRPMSTAQRIAAMELVSKALKRPNSESDVPSELPDAPIIARLAEGDSMLTGVSQLDIFHPLRRGLRTALIGTRRSDLSPFAISILRGILESEASQREFVLRRRVCAREPWRETQPRQPVTSHTVSISEAAAELDSLVERPKTVFVYAVIGRSQRATEEILDRLRRSGILNRTTVIVANQEAPALMQQQAFNAAVATSSYWRARGYHAVCVVDDLLGHARATTALTEPVMGQAAWRGVAATHSLLMENFAQLTPAFGGGSSTLLLLVEERPMQLGPETARTKSIVENAHASVDHVIRVDEDLASAGIWPAIEVGANVRGIRFQTPLLRQLLRRLNETLAISRETFEASRVGEDLGLHTEEEALQLIEWRPKVQLLLVQSQREAVPLHRQYLPLFAALCPRLLVGIPVRLVPKFKTVLLKTAEERIPHLLLELLDLIMPEMDNGIKSAEPRILPQGQDLILPESSPEDGVRNAYGELVSLPPKLNSQLEKFCEAVMKDFVREHADESEEYK